MLKESEMLSRVVKDKRWAEKFKRAFLGI